MNVRIERATILLILCIPVYACTNCARAWVCTSVKGSLTERLSEILLRVCGCLPLESLTLHNQIHAAFFFCSAMRQGMWILSTTQTTQCEAKLKTNRMMSCGGQACYINCYHHANRASNLTQSVFQKKEIQPGCWFLPSYPHLNMHVPKVLELLKCTVNATVGINVICGYRNLFCQGQRSEAQC